MKRSNIFVLFCLFHSSVSLVSCDRAVKLDVPKKRTEDKATQTEGFLLVASVKHSEQERQRRLDERRRLAEEHGTTCVGLMPEDR